MKIVKLKNSFAFVEGENSTKHLKTSRPFRWPYSKGSYWCEMIYEALHAKYENNSSKANFIYNKIIER